MTLTKQKIRDNARNWIRGDHERRLRAQLTVRYHLLVADDREYDDLRAQALRNRFKEVSS